tara:strand:+ start:436 stop:666 length:231 start_codon:yes stop_codon:yes gene_type:complete
MEIFIPTDAHRGVEASKLSTGGATLIIALGTFAFDPAKIGPFIVACPFKILGSISVPTTKLFVIIEFICAIKFKKT